MKIADFVLEIVGWTEPRVKQGNVKPLQRSKSQVPSPILERKHPWWAREDQALSSFPIVA